MRKLLFRFLLIGLLITSLLKISNNTEYNYSTTIYSPVLNIEIDLAKVYKDFVNNTKTQMEDVTTDNWRILEAFGYKSTDTEK